MESRNTLLFISSLLILLSITNADNIETTCSKTHNIHLCSSILRQDPGNRNKDTRGQVDVLVGALKSKAESAMNSFEAMMSSSSIGHELMMDVQACNHIYRGVVHYMIPQLTNALNRNAYFAENNALSIIEAAADCEDKFEPGSNHEVSDINKSVTELGIVVKEVIKQLLPK